MKFKELAKEIAKREGLKKSADIAQITEILGHLADILATDTEYATVIELLSVADKRAKKKVKKSGE